MRGTTQGRSAQKNTKSSEMWLDRCLVDGDPQANSIASRTRGKTFGISLAIEFAMLALLLVAPLFNSTAQTQLQKILPPQLAFFGNWHQPDAGHRPTISTATRKSGISNPFHTDPTPNVAVNSAVAGEQRDFAIPDVADGGAGPILTAGIVVPPPVVEPPHAAQAAQPEKRPVKLSEGVLQAQLISRIEPQYPPLARQTRTEGTVQLHAIIGRDGRITSLEVISGHPLLAKAALDAVRQWSYRPTLLNGEAVEVETSITVIFRLHQ